MKTYYVKFAYGEEAEPQVRSFKATSSGRAVQKCLCEYPGAKVRELFSEGGLGANYGCTVYEVPPSGSVSVGVKAQPAPAPSQGETTIPFFDESRRLHC